MGVFWRWRRHWRFRRPLFSVRSTPHSVTGRIWQPKPWKITLLAGVLIAILGIGFLEARLRPMVVTAAQAQAQNTIAGVVEHAIFSEMERQTVAYSDLVSIQRDTSGTITALTTETVAMNRLRARLVGVVLEALEGIDVSQIQIPLGSLLDLDLLWGLGPTMSVHAMAVGTVEGEFSSEFSSAGINQTIHKIELDLVIPLTLMLPGRVVETVCETQIPIAETVIVGQVPETYLQF